MSDSHLVDEILAENTDDEIDLLDVGGLSGSDLDNVLDAVLNESDSSAGDLCFEDNGSAGSIEFSSSSGEVDALIADIQKGSDGGEPLPSQSLFEESQESVSKDLNDPIEKEELDADADGESDYLDASTSSEYAEQLEAILAESSSDDEVQQGSSDAIVAGKPDQQFVIDEILREGEEGGPSPAMEVHDSSPLVQLQRRTQSSTMLDVNDSELLVLTRYSAISAELRRPQTKAQVGSPKCLAVHSKMIAVGMSYGMVMVYNAPPREDLRAILRPQATGMSSLSSGVHSSIDSLFGSVVCMDIFSDQNSLYLLCGYEKGPLVLWDVSQESIVRVISDAHHLAVVHVRFLSNRNLFISVDLRGQLKLHSIQKVLLLRSVINTEVIIEGAHGSIYAVDTSEVKTITEFPEPTMLLACARGDKALILLISPIQRILYEIPNPSGAKPVKSGIGQTSSLPCLSWRPSRPSEEGFKVLDPVLAIGWGRYIQLFQVHADMTMVSPHAEGIKPLDAQKQSLATTTFSVVPLLTQKVDVDVVSIDWLSERVVLYLDNNENFCVFDPFSAEVVEHVPAKDLNIYYDRRFDATSYHNSIRNDQHNVYILSRDSLSSVCGRSWADRINRLVERGQHLDAMELAVAFYDHTAKGVFGPVRDLSRLQTLAGRKLTELLKTYVDYCLQELWRYLVPERKSESDCRRFLIELCELCMKYCIRIDRRDVLFNDLYMKIASCAVPQGCNVNPEGVFLMSLEKFVLNDDLTTLPDHILEKLIQHNMIGEEGAEMSLNIEQCLCHITVEGTRIPYVLQLCSQNRLYLALLHLYTDGLNDFFTPLSLLLRNVTVENSNPTDPEHIKVKGILFGFMESAVKGVRFHGRKRRLEVEERERQRKGVLDFVLHIETSESRTASCRYMNLFHLMRLDSKRVLAIIGKCATPGAYAIEELPAQDVKVKSKSQKSISQGTGATMEGELNTRIANAVISVLSTQTLNSAETRARYASGVANGEYWLPIEISSSPTFGAFCNAVEFLGDLVAIKAIPKDFLNRFHESDPSSSRGQVPVCQFLYVLVRVVWEHVALIESGGDLSSLLFDRFDELDRLVVDSCVIFEQPLVESGPIFADLAAMVTKSRWLLRSMLWVSKRAGRPRDIIASLLSTYAAVQHARGSERFGSMVSLQPDEVVCEVFDYIERLFHNLGGDDAVDRQSTMTTLLLDYLPQLVEMSAEQTAKTVMTYFPDDQGKVLTCLEGHPQLQFEYLKGVLKVKQDADSSDPSGNPGQSLTAYMRESNIVNSVVSDKYLELLCQFEPKEVCAYLEQGNIPDRLDLCLKLVRDTYHIPDATAYILEKTGDIRGALRSRLEVLDNATVALETKVQGQLDSSGLNEVMKRIEKEHIGSVVESKGARKNAHGHYVERLLEDSDEGKVLKDALRAVLNLALRNTTRTRTATGEEQIDNDTHQMWFGILDHFILAQRHLRMELSRRRFHLSAAGSSLPSMVADRGSGWKDIRSQEKAVIEKYESRLQNIDSAILQGTAALQTFKGMAQKDDVRESSTRGVLEEKIQSLCAALEKLRHEADTLRKSQEQELSAIAPGINRLRSGSSSTNSTNALLSWLDIFEAHEDLLLCIQHILSSIVRMTLDQMGNEIPMNIFISTIVREHGKDRFADFRDAFSCMLEYNQYRCDQMRVVSHLVASDTHRMVSSSLRVRRKAYGSVQVSEGLLLPDGTPLASQSVHAERLRKFRQRQRLVRM